MLTMITFGEFSESFLNSEENSDGVGARCRKVIDDYIINIFRGNDNEKDEDMRS